LPGVPIARDRVAYVSEDFRLYCFTSYNNGVEASANEDDDAKQSETKYKNNSN